jgi:hypothetical protein
MKLVIAFAIGAVCCGSSGRTGAGVNPFAATVLEFAPAPGQFVNHPSFLDPSRALGAPSGGGTLQADNSSMVSLGGFGGYVVLAFDHTVLDDAANPFGLDGIVFGNALWANGDPNWRFAECGVIEIGRDTNGNGLADDAWYLIPGSHVVDPVGQYAVQTWDDNFGNPMYPPANPAWVPAGFSGVWTTDGYLLPGGTFNVQILENPNGAAAEVEGVWGYADHSPTLLLGDMDGDNAVDDAGILPEAFYTVPDNPFAVGMTPGSGGGDAFDIAWAVDPQSGAPAGLDGFDFIRITTGVNFVAGGLGEISTEIDAVADVSAGQLGDADGNGLFALGDFVVLDQCLAGPGVVSPPSPCRVMDLDQDGDVDLRDAAGFVELFDGD